MKISRCTINLVSGFMGKQRKQYLMLGLVALFVLASCKGNDSNRPDNTINPLYTTDGVVADTNSDGNQTNGTISAPAPQSERIIEPIDSQSIIDLVQRCTVETNNIMLPDNSELTGLIQDGANFSLGKLTSDFSWEIIPGTQQSLPLKISPDAKWLAYLVSQNSANDSLRLVDATAEFIEYDMGFSISLDSQWLFDEFLVLVPNDNSRSKYLFNPFSNETQSFPDYPDESIDKQFTNVYWFNPQGTQVVYLESNESYRSFYSSEKYVIYNFENKEEINTDLSWVSSLPAWSPDGKYLAVVSLGRTQVMRQIPSQEIFFIELSTGNSRQISDFFELFEGVSIHNLTWSPDGRYLLFELDIIDNSLPELFEPSLYIIDLQEQQVIDLCLDNIDDISATSYLWSPNGQLVSWNSRSGDMYLFDVTLGSLLHQSSSEAGLIGWLATDSVED